MIEIIVSDLGKVLLPFDTEPVWEQLVAACPECSDTRGVFLQVFTEADLGKGVTDPEEFYRRLVHSTGMTLSFVEFCRIWSDMFWEDVATISLIMAAPVRERHILSNTNALTEFLPETLSSFLAEHPQVSIDLEERLSDEIVGLIAEGSADIGIVAGTVDASRLTTYPFRSDRFVLVVARNHPLAERNNISFAEVLDCEFVGLERSSSWQRFLSGRAAREGRPLRLRVQLRSFDAVCRLVECGVGVGVVPQTTASRAAKTMDLAVVQLADDWALRELKIVVRADEELRPYAQELVESLRG